MCRSLFLASLRTYTRGASFIRTDVALPAIVTDVAPMKDSDPPNAFLMLSVGWF